MSEENQENGSTNGSDVPEIELIIKEENICTNEPKNKEVDDERKILPQENYNEKENTNNAKNEIYSDPEKLENQEVKPHPSSKCDKTKNIEDNKVLTINSEEKYYLHPSFENNFSPFSTKLERSMSTEDVDLASVVAEACEGLFEDIENELDLNLTLERDSPEPTENCECGSVLGKRDSEAMQLAVYAVLNGGLSLGQAAKKYNVVKSTIWSRVSKHPKHRRRKINKELEEIIQYKLSAGESLSEISRSLNIAKSTVHQHKTRLTKFGKLPIVLHTKKDSEAGFSGGIKDRLMQAYRGYKVNGMSVRFAAEFYSVPLTTFWRFIKRNQSVAVETLEFNTNDRFEEISSNKVKNNCESIMESSIKTEFDPEDQKLFEQTLLDHLFE